MTGRLRLRSPIDSLARGAAGGRLMPAAVPVAVCMALSCVRADSPVQPEASAPLTLALIQSLDDSGVAAEAPSVQRVRLSTHRVDTRVAVSTSGSTISLVFDAPAAGQCSALNVSPAFNKG